MTEMVVIGRARRQSNYHQQLTAFYISDALPVTQPTVAKQERNIITFRGPAHPKLTWGLPTLTMTNKGSWLPWERVARQPYIN